MNSFDTVPNDFNFPKENTNGSADSNKISVKEGKKDGDTSTHEIGHTLGLDHSGGLMSPTSGGNSLNGSHVTEMLNGVGIGGKDNGERNKNSAVGNGLLRPETGKSPFAGGYLSSAFLNEGRVMSQRKFDRVQRREERRENRGQ